MIIVKLMGGLGNQMFQYAAGKALAAHHSTALKLDLDFLLDRTPRGGFVFRDYDLDVFVLEAERASNRHTARYNRTSNTRVNRYARALGAWIGKYRRYHEQGFHYNEEFFRLPRNAYLDGYWQSPKYFAPIKDQIRADFTFKDSILEGSQRLKGAILNDNSVCINVRRADFLASSFHGVCDMEYFAPAIESVASKVFNPHFFIFSDDPPWCLENLRVSYPVTFVGHEHAGTKFSNYLQLMSLCKHYIIPNSSFAWWAVWLNGEYRHDRIVIAPRRWFTDPTWDTKDLIPAEWLRFDN